MPGLITLLTLAGFLPGVALGWYLRRINTWCPTCGHALSCTSCGQRPSRASPRREHRPHHYPPPTARRRSGRPPDAVNAGRAEGATRP
jgi:hypothetical protein